MGGPTGRRGSRGSPVALLGPGALWSPPCTGHGQPHGSAQPWLSASSRKPAGSPWTALALFRHCGSPRTAVALLDRGGCPNCLAAGCFSESLDGGAQPWLSFDMVPPYTVPSRPSPSPRYTAPRGGGMGCSTAAHRGALFAFCGPTVCPTFRRSESALRFAVAPPLSSQAVRPSLYRSLPPYVLPSLYRYKRFPGQGPCYRMQPATVFAIAGGLGVAPFHSQPPPHAHALLRGDSELRSSMPPPPLPPLSHTHLGTTQWQAHAEPCLE